MSRAPGRWDTHPSLRSRGWARVGPPPHTPSPSTQTTSSGGQGDPVSWARTRPPQISSAPGQPVFLRACWVPGLGRKETQAECTCRGQAQCPQLGFPTPSSLAGDLLIPVLLTRREEVTFPKYRRCRWDGVQLMSAVLAGPPRPRGWTSQAGCQDSFTESLNGHLFLSCLGGPAGCGNKSSKVYHGSLTPRCTRYLCVSLSLRCA